MLAGLIIGTVIKVGEPPPTIKTVKLGGPYSNKETPYAGFSSVISGHYEVELESAQMDGKPLPLTSAYGFGPLDTTVDWRTGNYVLPFQWSTDKNLASGDTASIDLRAYYVPTDNYRNRRRIMKGLLNPRVGSAHWKTAYVVDMTESEYPDVEAVPELRAYFAGFMLTVSDISYNSRLPMWDDLRRKYSKMLCAVVDIRISAGGVSS
jgi:hypothetical protein